MDQADLSVARFATVMNGGVSLAVWMGGVTHELERLVRCRRPDSDPTVWTEFVEKVGTRVLVDLVAGTSAGGVNGALLATAVGRGARLPDLKAVWASDGKLKRTALLHKTHPKEPNSVLDGGYFAEKVVEHLADITNEGQDAWAEDVTLLVTASALSGTSIAGEDSLDRKFRASDHRRVYKFESRIAASRWHLDLGMPAPAPVNDFHARAVELAIAARSSAGFPFAFESHAEGPDLMKLRNQSLGPSSWLIDGGVLDNAPIGALIRELQSKPRVDAGARWIVYVVPTMDSEPHILPSGPGTEPPPWTSIPGRLVSLWRESDLRQDVEDLRSLARTTNTSAQVAEDLINPTMSIVGKLEEVGLGLLDAYRRTRAYQNLVELDADSDQLSTRKPMNRTAVDKYLTELDLAWIPEVGQVPTQSGELRRGLVPRRTFDEIADPQWQWGITAAQRLVFWMSRDARRQGSALPDTLLEELAKIAWQLEIIAETLKGMRDEIVKAATPSTAPLADINEAYVTSPLLAKIDELIETAVSGWTAARAPDTSLEDVWQRLLAVEVMENATSFGGGISTPPFKFLMISPETPYEGTNLDMANLAQRPGWGSAKLYGTQYGHFGAFATTEWKEWDWRWGRIDGALTLATALSQDTTLTQDEINTFKQRLIDEILHQEGDVTPRWLAEKSRKLADTDPSALLKEARDSGQVDFDALFDDLKSMVQSSAPLNQSSDASVFKRLKTKTRAWASRRAAGIALNRLRKKVDRIG